MTALGLPSDTRAASRAAGSGNAGTRITFADVMTFLYVRQAEINRDIAHSQDSYREPKRRAVFELLYGLTNPDILKMRSDLNALNAKVTAAEAEYQNVVAFLHTSRTASRTQVERDIADLRAAEAQAEADQTALRHEINSVTDRETLALQDLLTDAERALADARDAANYRITLDMYVGTIAGVLDRARKATEGAWPLRPLPECAGECAPCGCRDAECRAGAVGGVPDVDLAVAAGGLYAVPAVAVGVRGLAPAFHMPSSLSSSAADSDTR